MPILRTAKLACSVALGLTAVAYADLSFACSQLPGYSLTVETTHVPVGGVLVANVFCETDCGDGPPTLTVLDTATGETVAGTTELLQIEDTSERHQVWRPDAALVEGRTYRVEFGDDARHAGDFAVVAASTFDPTSLALDAEVQLIDNPIGEPTCCPRLRSSCEPLQHCFTEEVERKPLIHVELTDATPSLGQFLKRVTFWAGDDGEPNELTTYYPSAGYSPAGAADEYCYEIELTSLVDGTRHTLPRECKPHGDAGETGILTLTQEELAETVAQCDEPPPNYRGIWCSVVDELCEQGRTAACEAIEANACHDDVGPGGPGVGGSGSGSGGAAATGGSGGAAAGSGGDSPGTGGATSAPSCGQKYGPTDCDVSDDEGGCSIGGARPRGSSWAVAVFGVGLAWALRRRRQSA